MSECENIRQMSASDLMQVLSWRNRPEVRRYMLTQHEISSNEHRKWFDRSSNDPTRRLLIVEDAGIALGFVQFKNVAPDASADWGFYAAPDLPKGSGTKMGIIALNYAFKALNLHKVCGQALSFNVASIHMHHKLGFQQEGLLRQQYQIDGAYYDLVCFGLLKDEWSA